MSNFTDVYKQNISKVKQKMRTDENFDIIVKKMKLPQREASVICLNGFVKDDILERSLQYLTKLKEEDMKGLKTAGDFLEKHITFISASSEKNTDFFISSVLSGNVGLIIEGYSEGILIDCRNYPARNVQEPESDKVLRGSHEGFVENIITNTALIRKKVRDTNLTMKRYKIGRESKTDVVLCYLEDEADKRLLKNLDKKLSSIDVKSLPLGHESLRECLTPGQSWNPFPKVRYTERPDAAAACIYEGDVIILTDGSPTAMITPTGIFDFAQDINDYYFSPVVGTMLRFLRVVVFALSMLFIPFWYLTVIHHFDKLPDYLMFMKIEEQYTVPIIVQLLIVEFVIDALRLASLNTPSALSSSFSVIGALVLGEFAVKSGWFVSEVVLFMAFVTIANFVQPSYELGYSVKIARTFILLLTALFKAPGFFVGLLAVILLISFTKTVTGYRYLYPLIPFNKKALGNLIIRKNIRFQMKKSD